MLVSLDRARTASTQSQWVSFTKSELGAIVSVYSTQVARGEWRDYALDFERQMAVFSIFRHAHDQPLAAIIKLPGNTSTGYLFEVMVERKRVARTPFLDRALEALREAAIPPTRH